MAKIKKLQTTDISTLINTTVYPQTVADAVALPGRTLTTAVNTIESNISSTQQDLSDFKATKGVAGGLAALDSAGRLPSEYLDDYVYVSGVAELDSIIEIPASISRQSCTVAEYPVVFITKIGGFLFKVVDATTGDVAYSMGWTSDADIAIYGEKNTLGLVIPVTGKIYIDKTENKCYRWDGSAMVPLVMVGNGLALGSGAADAYPGTSGTALEARVDHIDETMGPYSERESITLTPTTTGYVIDASGNKVAKSGWAMSEFTAEKGNVYLFKPGATDGNVSVFAEAITSVEMRAVDYTYTYNDDGTIATAAATYNGKTHSYTYAYDASGKVTITETGVGVVSDLPMTYTTTVGSYSPLVRLNADAELPKDGYCRYMSHFKGNSAIKVVVSYKVGSADLTMKVTRDGVLASISTQLGNLSQKEDETRGMLEKMNESYIEVMSVKETYLNVDGQKVTIPARVKTKLKPMKTFRHYNGYSDEPLYFCDASHLDTSKFTNMHGMFWNKKNAHIATLDVSHFDTSAVTSMQITFSGCSSLTSLDVSAWDVGAVTNMYCTFSGCSSLTSLDVSAWDTGAVTNMGGTFQNCSSLTSLDVSAWDTKSVTNMQQTFQYCSSLTSLDVSAWDTGAVTNMQGTFYGCSSLTSLDVSAWNTSAVTNMQGTFYGCSKLTSLDVANWNTENVTHMAPFCHMAALTRLDLSKWSTKSVTTFGSGFYMFLNNMPQLTEILFGEGWGTNPTAVELNMQYVGTGKSYKLTDATWASMLTMYDRKSAGLADMTIKLSTKHNVPSGWEEQMTARGYIITKA